MYVSKTMQKFQRNYTLIEKDMLAVTTCLKKFSMWIYGRLVHVNEGLRRTKNKFRELAQTRKKAATWITILNSFDVKYDIKNHKRSNNNFLRKSINYSIEPNQRLVHELGLLHRSIIERNEIIQVYDRSMNQSFHQSVTSHYIKNRKSYKNIHSYIESLSVQSCCFSILRAFNFAYKQPLYTAHKICH